MELIYHSSYSSPCISYLPRARTVLTALHSCSKLCALHLHSLGSLLLRWWTCHPAVSSTAATGSYFSTFSEVLEAPGPEGRRSYASPAGWPRPMPDGVEVPKPCSLSCGWAMSSRDQVEARLHKNPILF